MTTPVAPPPAVEGSAIAPLARRRVRKWLLLTGICVAVSIIFFGAIVYLRQRQLAEDVAKHSGNVGWYKPIGRIRSIAFPSGGVDDAWVHATRWKNVPSLQSLTMKSCALTDGALPPLLVLQSLQELDLERNDGLTPKGLNSLTALTSLQRLSLDVEVLTDGENAVSHLSKLTQLRELNFFGYETAPPGLDQLQKALPTTKVQVINPTASSMGMRPVVPAAKLKVLFRPAGDKLVVSDGEGVVRLYDVASQTLVWTQQAHADWLFGMAFDPTGEILATAGGDDTIRLWDMETHSLLATLAGHGDDVHALAFSPDGQSLLSSSDDMTVRQWSIPPLLELRSSGTANAFSPTATWTGQDDTLPSLAVSPDGSWVASGSRDGTVQLRKLATGAAGPQLVHSIHKRPRDERGLSVGAFDPQRPRGDVMGVAFHPRHTQLATTGYDGQIRLWKVPAGEVVTEWTAHAGWAFGVAYLPAGDQLVSWGRKGQICLWSSDGQLVREFQADDDVASVAVSPKGDQLAACTASGQLQLWSLRDPAQDGRVISSLLPFRNMPVSRYRPHASKAVR